MTSASSPHQNRPLIQQLRAAERVYVEAIRSALADDGYEDLPPRGIVITMGLRREGSSVRDVSRRLGITSQAVSQLVDTLVARGYVQRSPDEVDRRRIVLSLTERGHGATTTTAAAISAIDKQLTLSTTADERAALHHGLEALIALGDSESAELDA